MRTAEVLRRCRPRTRAERMVGAVRAVCQGLEPRWMMAINNYVGPSGGDWNTPENWDAGVPNATSDVRLPAATEVVISASGQQAASIMGALDSMLTVSGPGALQVFNTSTLGNLSLAGTLTLSAATTVAGAGSVWSGGSLTGSPAVTISGGLSLTGSVLNLTGGSNLLVTGSVTQTTGELRTNSSTLSVTGGSYDFQAGLITTSGGAAGLSLTLGSVFKKSLGASGSLVGVPYSSSAGVTTRVDAGTLTLGGAGTSTGGDIVVASGATLDLTGGASPVYQGTYNGTGAGTVSLSNGQFLVGAGGATLNFAPGLFHWTGGNIAGGNPVMNANVINIPSGIVNLVGGTNLTNNGTILQTGGELRTNSSTITNAAGKLFELDGGATITTSGGPAAFNNSGTLQKVSGTANAVVLVPYNSVSNAIARSDVGTLVLGNGGSSTGGMFVSTGTAMIDLTGGSTPTLVGTYTGSGRVSLANGQLIIGAGGATFNFPQDVFQWTGGNITGGNGLSNTGFITIPSGIANLVGGANLTNNGTILHTGGELRTNSSIISNTVGHVYDLQGGAIITTSGGAAAFNNAGTLTKSTGIADARVLVPYNSVDGAIVESGAGTLVLGNGGSSTGGIFRSVGTAVVDLTGGNNTTWVGTYTGSGHVSLANGQLLIGAGGATLNFPQGVFEWTGGNINGGNPVTNLGFIAIPSGLTNLVGGTNLTNNGTILQTGGELRTNSSVINNSAGKLYRLDGGATITTSGGPASFNNAGTLVKLLGTTDASVLVPYNSVDGGVAKSDEGKLVLGNGGTSSGGSFISLGTAVVDITGGSNTTWAGTFTGSGHVSLASGQLLIGGGGATLNFPEGVFEWTGGNINGGNPITNAGFLTIPSGLVNLVGGTNLTNNGTILHFGGELRTNSSVINNSAGRTYQLDGGGLISTSGGPAAFNNLGVLQKLNGTSTAFISVPYNTDTGTTTRIEAGMLTLNGGGTSTGGTFIANNDAVVDLTGGSIHSLGGRYTGGGTGTVKLINGQIFPSSAGLVFDFPAGFFQWSGGNINGRAVTNAATGTLTIPSGIANLVGGATFVNNGVVQVLGELRTNSSVINNSATGSFSLSGGGSVTTSGGPAAFSNTGLLRKPMGAGTAHLLVPYIAVPGAIAQADEGGLNLGGGGTSTGGTFIAASGAVIDLTGGNSITLRGTYGGSGAGTVSLASGQIFVDPAGATFNFPAGLFKWTGGNLNGGGTLTNSGTLAIPSGVAGLVGGTTIANQGTLVLSGGELRTNSSVLVNETGGTVSLSGGSVISTTGGRAGVTNAGVVDVSGAETQASIFVPFDNTGLTRVRAGTLSLTGSISQLSTATLTGGSWTVAGGALLSTPNAPAIVTNQGIVALTGAGAQWNKLGTAFTSNAGSLTLDGGASLSPAGAFTNAGRLLVASGDPMVGASEGIGSKLILGGGYSETGTLAIRISGTLASSAFGMISGGVVTLSGSLGGSLATGFIPTLSERYLLVDNTGADPVAGTFAGLAEGTQVVLNNGSDNVEFFISYVGGTGNDVVLTAGLPLRPNVAVAVAADVPFAQGQTATLTFNVANTGNADSSSGVATVFISTSPTFDPLTATRLGNVNVPAVAAGESVPVTASFSIPVSTTVATYYVTTLLGAQTFTTTDTPLTVTQRVLPIMVGNLDPRFGINGIATTTIAGAPFRTVDSVSQTDGKLVVAGSEMGAGAGFVLLRINVDGSLDTSFGTAGVVRTGLGGSSGMASSVTLDRDGRILLAGASGGSFALLRFAGNGDIDGSFGTAGVVRTGPRELLGNTAATDSANTVIVASDGSIYVAGTSDASVTRDFAVVRYSSSGAVDTTYGTSGVALVDFSGGVDIAHTLSIQKDAKIVVSGYATLNGTPRIAAARLLTGGTLDTKFGNKGKVVFAAIGPDDEIFASAIQADGKIVLGGFTSQGSPGNISQSSFYLTRLLTNGKVDTKFGTKGQVISSLAGVQFSAINDLKLTADGKILAAGKTAGIPTDAVNNRLGVAVARYTSAGKLDPTYNQSGVLNLFQPANAPANIRTLAVTDLSSDFSTFATTSVGLVDLLPGGLIRTLASTPSATRTEVSVAAIVPDGVDLIASSFSLTRVPTAVVGGAKGQASVTIANVGTLPIKTKIPVTLSLSTDGVSGPNNVAFVTTDASVSLKAGTAKATSLKFLFPSTLPDGDYFVIVSLDAVTKVQDINPTNNDRAVASTTRVAAPFVDLSLAFAPPLPGSIAAGKAGKISLRITNNGNVPARGGGVLSLLASADGVLGAEDFSLFSSAPKFNLAPGKSATLRISVKTTAQSLPPSPAFLVASLAFNGTPGDSVSVFSDTAVTFT